MTKIKQSWNNKAKTLLMNGKPVGNNENLAEILRRENIQVFHNDMNQRIEIRSLDPNHEINELDGLNSLNNKITFITNRAIEYQYPVSRVRDNLFLLAENYHPVITWINGQDWDGTYRFDQLFNALNVQGNDLEVDLAMKQFRVWCNRAVKGAFTKDGYPSEYVLCLKGDQGAGKTRFIRSLAPSEFIKTGIQLDPKNKDSILTANSAWIIELGEFDAITRKNDHAVLKAYLSQDHDYVRKPYAVVEDKIPRRTIFAATVNSGNFLMDETGNRRYFILEIGETNPNHGIDMQQFWAEIYFTMHANELFWLDKKDSEFQQSVNEKFRQIDPIEEMIFKAIADQTMPNEISNNDALEHIGIEKPHSGQSRIANNSFLKAGWEKVSQGSNRYVWKNPKPYKLNDPYYFN